MTNKTNSKKSDKVEKAGGSWRRMRKLIEPYAPKATGTLKPHTGEWVAAEDYKVIEPKDENRLKHASDPT